jgi:hypothetical protein
MGLKETLKKIFQKNERFKEMQAEVKFQKMVEDRQKSANEREIEKFLHDRREEAFKNQVREIHNMEKQKHWSGGFGMSNNIFSNHKSILSEDNHLFGMKGNIL